LEQLSAAQKIKLRREELNKKGASKKVAKTKEKKSQEQIKKIKNNITTVSNLYL
jgi:hypothetical protein